MQEYAQRPPFFQLARVGLENHRTENRSERQGHDAGEDDGRGHRDAELAVEGADRPGHEGHRNEDRRHHQGDGDDRAADLVNNLLGRQIGREVLLVHLGMHRFDHHNRVVHHDADRQHQREERDQVDRETEQLHEKEGPDQRTGTARVGISVERQSPRNKKTTESHQHEGLEQGVEHLLDGGLQEAGNVVADLKVHAGRE